MSVAVFKPVCTLVHVQLAYTVARLRAYCSTRILVNTGLSSRFCNKDTAEETYSGEGVVKDPPSGCCNPAEMMSKVSTALIVSISGRTHSIVFRGASQVRLQ
ncbi:hypothetical protein F5888DRAFT_1669956 [Russula emetica]|nr:hypothetical protein F5888DRAFT_1669956 [Russula emetica]